MLGIVLLAISFFWATVAPAGGGWTNEKSERMSELGSRAHVLGGQVEAGRTKPKMHGGRSQAEVEAEHKQVNEELTQLREEFEGKRDRPQTTASLLRWIGVGCVAIGAIAMMATRNG